MTFEEYKKRLAFKYLMWGVSVVGMVVAIFYGVVNLWFGEYIFPTILSICLLTIVYFLILTILNEQGYKLERKFEDYKNKKYTNKF